jgi:hypothetical protein
MCIEHIHKIYIIILSHIVLYYIYPCHIHGWGRGCGMSHEGHRSPHSQWDQQSNAILLHLLIPRCLLRVISGSHFWSFEVLN